MAILSVIFLQWLLLYQRRHDDHHDDGSSTVKPSVPSVDFDHEVRTSSPELVLPSVTIVPPSACPSDEDNDDAETVQAESITARAPSDSAAVDKPSNPVSSSNYSSDDESPEVLLPASSAPGRRRASEASANVLQLINEQRRFSVSAASSKSATTGGVTGQCSLNDLILPLLYATRNFGPIIIIIRYDE